MFDSPPLDPGAEPRLPGHAFDAECVALCQELLSEGEQLCGQHIVTQTEKWGLVWRADYQRPGPEFPNRVNRVVCWKSPAGEFCIEFAGLQQIAPLGDAGATPDGTSTGR